MAYELGAGLGIAIFGLLLSRSFSASIRLPAGLEAQEIARASSSMGEAVQLANSLPPTQGRQYWTPPDMPLSGRIAWR